MSESKKVTVYRDVLGLGAVVSELAGLVALAMVMAFVSSPLWLIAWAIAR